MSFFIEKTRTYAHRQMLKIRRTWIRVYKSKRDEVFFFEHHKFYSGVPTVATRRLNAGIIHSSNLQKSMELNLIVQMQ